MKRVLTALTFALFSGIILVSAIQAEAYHDKKARIQIDTPRGWETEVDGADLLINSPDELVMMFFHVAKADDMEDALDELEEELDDLMKNVKEGKPKEGTIRGMDYLEISGTGVVEGVKVNWDVTILQNGDNDPVIIISILFPGWKKHSRALKKFADSIKPI